MTQTQSTAESIEAEIIRVASELRVNKAILFGSFARGTETARSDVDVVFVQETSERFIERPARIMRMLYSRIRGRGIDVLVYTPAEFKKMIDSGNSFVRHIITEGRVLYES